MQMNINKEQTNWGGPTTQQTISENRSIFFP